MASFDSSSRRRKLLFYEFIEGELTFITPFHIGSGELSGDTDSPILRDSTGAAYIPGTSIAGPLRSLAEELFPDYRSSTQLMFGYAENERSSPSRLWVEDAYPAVQPMWKPLRDGVAIHRGLHASASQLKYDYEITPQGMKVPLRLRLELRQGDPVEELREILTEILNTMVRKQIKFGGYKSRGLGRCRLEYQWRRLDFRNTPTLADYLIYRDPKRLPLISANQAQPKLSKFCRPFLRGVLHLEVCQRPFLIKDGRNQEDHDAVFYAVPCTDGSSLDTVPGSSLKGIFRSRAEKILRTLGEHPCDPTGDDACTLRIKTEMKPQKRSANDFQWIWKNSCPICRLFGNGYLASRISFDDAFFDPSPQKKRHVQISLERISGKVADHGPFDSMPVVKGVLPVYLELRDPSVFDKMLVLMVLRDLKVGFPPLRLGYGTRKGYGDLHCESIAFNDQEMEASSASWPKSLGIELNGKSWWKIDE